MGGIIKLQGKRVLLTGAAGGIGTLLAKRLLAEGCHLLLVDRDEDGLSRLAHDLSQPERVECQPVDLTESTQIERLIESLRDSPLHVLINNAGLAPGVSFAQMDLADVQRVMTVNLESVIQLTHGLLPNLLRADKAQIINMASASGLAAPGGMVAYAASKFGLVGFSEALRAELHSQGVGVSVICPAFVKTDIVHNSRTEDAGAKAGEQERLERLDRYVRGHGITPEKVVRATMRAIRRNQAQVVLGAPYRLAIGLRFFFPGLVGWINRRNYEKMKTKGLLR